MQPDELITQCPACATSFNVTEAQLNAAGGSVRCGACLQIFQAGDYVLSAEGALDAEGSSYAEGSLEENAEGSLQGNAEGSLEESAEGSLEENADGSLEENADGSLEENAEGSLQGNADGSLEENAEGSLEESAEGSLQGDAEGSLQGDAEGSLEGNADGSLYADGSSYADGSIRDDDLQGFIGEIKLDEEEPQEIVGVYVPVRKSHGFAWAMFSLLAMLALVAQFAGFNKEALSQQPVIRDYYKIVCNILDCKIPEFVNTHGLSVSDLVIRTHPETARALKVDAIIRNEAAFKLPFPNLRLRFTDINERIIASRDFLPLEYLQGELSGLKYIPASTEVRLSLEIVDPDIAAVGYSMMVVDKE